MAIILRPKYIASVSGGKDSLYMLYHILSNSKKYPLDMVVHFSLEIDYPMCKDVTQKIKEICDSIKIPYYEITPRKSWDALYEEKGFPSKVNRWCNWKYKEDCKKQVNEYVKMLNCRPVWYIGFCADEPKRFRYIIGNIKQGQNEIYPLAEDGILESEILEWAKHEPVFNDYYKICKRQGCMFCPMASMRELAYQMLKFPDISEKFWSMVIKEYDVKGFNCLNGSGDKYNPHYVYNIVKTKWLPRVKKQLEEVNYDSRDLL